MSVKVHKDHQVVRDHGPGSWWAELDEAGSPQLGGPIKRVFDADGTTTDYREGDFDAIGVGIACGGPHGVYCPVCAPYLPPLTT